MHVAVGDVVQRGQVLFEDRKTEGVVFTAPGAGKIVAINRGARRALQSVVIELAESERTGEPSPSATRRFESFTGADPATLDRDTVRSLLVESGLWTALRQRPYSKVPSPAESCRSIFVTAIDTNPHAPDPEVVLEGKMDAFHRGLQAVATQTDGPVYLCRKRGAGIDAGPADGVQIAEFEGKHPAGLAGTHIHFLDPVGGEGVPWYIGYQDVAAIGTLVCEGTLDVERVVSLAGPVVRQPRLLRTRLGASIDELVRGELEGDDLRVISGSVLHGRVARGKVWGYLGRYSCQIAALAEGRERTFLRWVMPGFKVFSTVRAFAAGWLGKKSFAMTTTTNGGHRAMVPIGMFERIMPLDIMPTFLLRALVMGDIERAEALGCLELDEEDLALCSFVSPGKEDFGVHLRSVLTEIWKEG
jgi:Na+-transporting NADH:ubiquinone oxidoreductase subunit A